MEGQNPWRFSGNNGNPYALEHVSLLASVRGDAPYLNEGVRVAESTLTAIMGRMSAYTGKAVTWEQAMNSTLDVMPKNPALGAIETPEVAVPGKTALV
jgi:myo-inositol 2-dehydrogenase/D-chiro-inositol 1-dehydrogenase